MKGWHTRDDGHQCSDAYCLGLLGTATPLRKGDKTRAQGLSGCVFNLDRGELSLAKVAVALVILLGQLESVEVKILLKSRKDYTSSVSGADDFSGQRKVGDILVGWKHDHDTLDELRCCQLLTRE